MTEITSGDGEALTPQIITLSKEQYDALVAKGSAIPELHDPVAAAHENLANAQAFVERQQSHLADAERALADAEAELAAVLDGGQ